MDDMFPKDARRGRGAVTNSTGRYEHHRTERSADGWVEQAVPAIRTERILDKTRTIIARNQSPDIPFDRSINPYRGCEHGCIYCFARPTHAYLGLSPGLDFESKIFIKPNAATLLEAELRKPGYKVAPIAIGTNTDPYQPMERDLRIMRAILEVLDAYSHPVAIVTKGGLITRDADILGRMAKRGLAKVALSVTTLDSTLSRKMEPRASAPQVRLRAVATLRKAGVPTGIMMAPIIPTLNDTEIDAVLTAATKSGAQFARYVALRLPLEVSPLFREWLEETYPNRAKRIMRYVQEMHGGKDYDPQWGKRMRGEGVYAQVIARRFELARNRLNLSHELKPLETRHFAPPPRIGEQLKLL